MYLIFSTKLDLESLTRNRDGLQNDHTELQTEHTTSLNTIKSLEGELGMLRQAKGDTDSSYKQEMEKHIEARDKIQHLETDLESLTRNRDGLQNDHTELQTEHTTSLNTIKRLETSVARRETEVQRLTDQLAEADKLLHQKEDNLQALVDDQQRRMDSQEQMLERLTSSLQDNEKQLQDMLRARGNYMSKQYKEIETKDKQIRKLNC